MQQYLKIAFGLFLITFLSNCSGVKNNQLPTENGKHLFNDSWKFMLQDEEAMKTVDYNDSNWRVLQLPHDWSIEGEYAKENPMTVNCGFLPAGIAWYRKTIEVPAAWKGKHVEIAFDGVFMNSTVWANGKKLGDRPYGWVSFAYDISDEVQNSNKITFAVRVDNDKQPSARWYTGSGIYANTWISVQNKVHIPDSGIFVKTEKSKVIIETEVKNDKTSNQTLTVVSSIQDASGKIVKSSTSDLEINSTEKAKAIQIVELDNPKLWEVETPYLYTLVSEVKSGETILDTKTTRFGVRDIEWIPETGMWLNGKNVKMRGVCNHQDAGALGAAVPDKILRFRLQQLKDMGCNAIRTAHNAQTPQFYDICDEMGFLVMDEFFDGWVRKAEHDYGAHAFDTWWKQDLTDLIKRDRNHPCVVIYSVGNETKGEIAKDLVATCHEVDNTRPVTSGHSGDEYMDIHGVNGGSEGKNFFKTLKKDRVFIGTENVHTWHTRGFYRTKMWYRDGYPGKSGQAHWYPDMTEEEVFTFDWTDGTKRQNSKQTLRSSYDNSTISQVVRHNIQKLRDIPNYAGTFRWTGYDYIGEAKYHGGWPFKSFSGGAIDMANFEKDLFYLYQSQWTNKPMVHILPHWTHPTLKEGTNIPVWVYSNCDEVELFFNGKSLGKQKPGTTWENMHCQWMVGYKPGEIKAVGYKNGKTYEEIIRTADAPSKIEVSVDGEALANKAHDVVQVRVTTTDDKGEFYPYGENRSYFKVLGAGKIRALDNGSPLDIEKHYEAESRIAFFGLTRAYVEATEDNGDITLLTGCILGEKKLITSKQVSIDTQLLNLRGNTQNVDVAVYYTTDGSIPTKTSSKYEKPFEVELGTTVKALVLVDGEDAFIMEERFAQDEGFYWDSTVAANVMGGDQAEDAKYKDAVLNKTGNNFNGSGYLEFGSNSNGIGFVEWYYENDQTEAEFNISIRYSGYARYFKEHKVILDVNGKKQQLKLKSTKAYRKTWDTFKAKATLNAGANYIKIICEDVNGLAIDELVVD